MASVSEHRGNEMTLIRYWAHGEGAVKIAWDVPGDFDRCLVELGKYVPPNEVKGFCARLHKEATGGWPGHGPGESSADKLTRQLRGE